MMHYKIVWMIETIILADLKESEQYDRMNEFYKSINGTTTQVAFTKLEAWYKAQRPEAIPLDTRNRLISDEYNIIMAVLYLKLCQADAVKKPWQKENLKSIEDGIRSIYDAALTYDDISGLKDFVKNIEGMVAEVLPEPKKAQVVPEKKETQVASKVPVTPTISAYAIQTIQKDINVLNKKLTDELDKEITRLGISKPTSGRSKLQHQARCDVVSELKKTINNMSMNELEKSGTYTVDNAKTWKAAYQSKLINAIKASLKNEKLDKYTPFEKCCKILLNILTSFPFAPIKYLITGSFFYSTEGKSKETVRRVLDISESITQPLSKP